MQDFLNYKAIGKRVRKLRLDKCLSQELLAEQCDISTSFLGHIERGTRKMSLETLVRLAAVLDVSTDYLLADRSLTSEHVLAALLSETARRLPPEQYKRLENAVKALIASADLL